MIAATQMMLLLALSYNDNHMYFIYKLGSNVFHNGYFDTTANPTFVYGTFNCHGTENYILT